MKAKKTMCVQHFWIFGNSKNLKRHTDIIHKGIKRWKCDNCTNAYGQSHELKKHKEHCHKSPKN